MPSEKPSSRNPWTWVPSLYYAEGIPYVLVMLVSVLMYKRMGISNTEIALYTSWLYLPWVIKPFWAPLVDIFKTKRIWIVLMQLIIGAGLAGVAFTIPTSNFLQYTLAFFFLVAFSSATHDIAADGFYMLGLSEHEQAFYVGIRSTFYRLAMITGQGILVILAGYFEAMSGLPPVDIRVEANPNAQIATIARPADIESKALDGELRILSSLSTLEIGISHMAQAEFDSIFARVQEYNTKNGFYTIEAPKKIEKQNEKSPEKQRKPVGNVGIVGFWLSKEPVEKREVVLHFDRHSGDKSILLVEGSRLVFNKNNWNKPAYSLVQLDAKLKTASFAVFRTSAGNIPWSWSMTFLVLTVLFLVFFLYHAFVLPFPAADGPALKGENRNFLGDFVKTFVLFFKKEHVVATIAFLLIFRFSEAQLVKLIPPFLIDPREAGGLGLTLGEVGLAYGTVGVVALTLGGILGGVAVSKYGLKKWIWLMFFAINIPNALYVYLSYAQPENLYIIGACVAGEQFGYGFGFTAYMLYMIYVSEGEFKTSHYAICTGFMALGMMLPGMFAGWLQEMLGYRHFFVWILFTMLPGLLILKWTPLNPTFGKKQTEPEG